MKRSVLVSAVMLVASIACADDFLKEADLAWTWYPSDRAQLSKMVSGYIDSASPEKIDGKIFAVIAPHAGYQFSGPVAGYAYRSAMGRGIKTVIVVGFSHRGFMDGVSVYDRGAWRTPLGNIEIDEKLAKAIIEKNPRFKFEPRIFKSENSIEMQVPFIQTAFKGAKIVPMAFGTQSYKDALSLSAALAGLLKDRDDVLVVASTDMSHFHTYYEANDMDKSTIAAIEKMDSKLLYDETLAGKYELCGMLPVVATIGAARELGYDRMKVLKYANSGDTSADKSRVVGYLSAAIYKEPPKPQMAPPAARASQDRRRDSALTDIHKKRLLQIARESIANFLVFGKKKAFKEEDPLLNEHRGAFVTLHENGQLRGCIGNIVGQQSLYKTISEMAIASATGDPRFRPLSAGELDKIDIEISVLTPPKKVKSPDEIKIPGHGVMVKRGFSGGVFLPQVADETGWSKDEFLSTLCAHKAGLPRDAWKDPGTELYIFSAEVFGEREAKK